MERELNYFSSFLEKNDLKDEKHDRDKLKLNLDQIM